MRIHELPKCRSAADTDPPPWCVAYLVLAPPPDVLAERQLLGREVELLVDEEELLGGGVDDEVGGEGDPQLPQLQVLSQGRQAQWAVNEKT